MATFDPFGSFTLDASEGLQTSSVATSTEDNNDDDVLRSTLPDLFENYLINVGLLPDPDPALPVDTDIIGPDNIGVGESATNFIHVEGDVGDVTDLNFSTTGGGALPTINDPSSEWISSGISVLDDGDPNTDETIYLFSDDATGSVANAGLTGKVVLGMTEDGTKAFALYLQNTDGGDDKNDWQVYSAQFEAFDSTVDGEGLEHDDSLEVANLGVAASEELFISFAGTPSGKFYGLVYVEPGSDKTSNEDVVGIVATADDPPNAGTLTGVTNDEKSDGNFALNVSQGGGPVTHGVDAQVVNENQSLTYSLVINPDRDHVIDNDTTPEDEGDFTQADSDLESSLTFDKYHPGTNAGFFTVVQTSGGGANGKTVLNLATYLNTDDADQGGNKPSGSYDNSENSTDPSLDGVRDGDETQAKISAVRVWAVTIDADTGVPTKVGTTPLFDSATANDLGNGVLEDNGIFMQYVASATDMDPNAQQEVQLAGIDDNMMVEFDLAGDADNPGLWNMLEISKKVPDQNWNIDDPFAGGKGFDIGGIGSASSTTSPATLTGVRFEDDGPELDIELKSGATLPLDETANDGDEPNPNPNAYLAQAEITAEDLFQVVKQSGGTDGLDASQTSYAFVDPGDDVDSGLVDTQSGQKVVYNLEVATGDIVGTTETDGDEVIRYSINASSGDVTASQSRAVVHPSAGDGTGGTHDETLTHPNSDLIVVTKTIFDKDGDFASDTVDITSIVEIDDDGPDVTVTGGPTDTDGLPPAVLLEHDETIGADRYNADVPEANDGGPNDDTAATSVTVSTAPTLAQAIGKDETAGGGEVGALFNVTEFFGSDGPGDTIDTDGRTDQLSLVLSETPLETNLVATALKNTDLETMNETQRTIWLVADSTDLDTRVNGVIAGADGVVDGDLDEFMVFSIVLENPTNLTTAKLVTYQFIPIDHDLSEPEADEAPEDPSLYDEEIELASVAENATLSIKLETKIEDGDEDTDVDDALVPIVDNAGSLVTFDDDGPNASVTTTGEEVVHDESPDLQNDGPPLFADAADVGDEDNDDDDRDGDPPTAITDFETAETPGGELAASRLGWAQSPGAVVEPDTDNDFGTDGPAATDSIQFSLDIPDLNGTDSGLQVLSGAGVTLFKDGDVIVGRVNDISGGTPGVADPNGDVALAIWIDPDTAVISIAQYLAIKHPDTTDDDDSKSLNTSALQAVMTIKDGDDDVGVATVDIGDKVSIEDDGPEPEDTDPLPLDEDNISISSALQPDALSEGLDEDSGDASDTHTRTDDLATEEFFDPGTDGPLSNLTFALVAGTEGDLRTANPFTSKGEQLNFVVNTTTNTVTGFADANTDNVFDPGERKVFEWAVTAGGMATMTVFDQLDQLAQTGEEGRDESNSDDDDQEEELVLTLTPALDVTDGDGDPVDLDADFIQYAVQDDMPDIGDSGANNVPVDDEDKLPAALIEFASSDSSEVNLEAVIGTDEGVNPNITGSGGVRITTWEGQIVYTDSEDNPVLTLTAVPDDATEDNVKVITYVDASDNDEPYFRLTIDDSDPDSTQWDYTWESLHSPPSIEQPVDFSAITSGPPVELIAPPVGSGGLVAIFDGLLMTTPGDLSANAPASSNSWTPGLDHDPRNPATDNDGTFVNDLPGNGGINAFDAPNPNNVGFGIKGGSTSTAQQSSQFNHNEGFLMAVQDTASGDLVDFTSLTFAINKIGNQETVNIDWVIIDDTGGKHTGFVEDYPISGNKKDPTTLTIDLNGDDMSAVYVRTWFDLVGGEIDTNVGVRLLDFKIAVPGDLDDKILDWAVEIEDFDGDRDQATFQTGIDGDLDGDVDGLGLV